MIKDGKVRPEGCICEPCSDISPNWKDIRTKFGYKMLCEIATGNFKFQKNNKTIYIEQIIII